MFRWQAHKGTIQSIAFAPTGELLGTATGSSKFVHLWDPRTGTLVRKLDAGSPVQAVVFAPGAPILAAATRNAVRVWETGGWAVMYDLRLELSYEVAVAPGPGPAVAAATAGGVSVWNRPIGKRAGHVLRAGSSVACLDFAPDGLLATNGVEEAGLWDPASGKRRGRWDRPGAGNRGPVKFSPDGRRVAIAHGKHVTVRAADPTAGAGVTLAGHRRPVWAIGWSVDGRVLMTASGDGTTRLWEAETGSPVRVLDWGAGKVYAAAFAPDGLTAAAAGENGWVVVWDFDE